MRILFSCSAGDGHFMPLLPLARAALRAGHQVAFATAGEFRERVQHDGFEFIPAGMSLPELERRWETKREELRVGSVALDRRRVLAFAGRFGEIDAPAKVGDLFAAMRNWQADLVVHARATSPHRSWRPLYRSRRCTTASV